MIFPPESIDEFRRELLAKMNSGALSEAEAYRQALAVDPNDPVAISALASAAEKDGDLPLAVQLAHRFIQADPLSHEGYAMLGRHRVSRTGHHQATFRSRGRAGSARSTSRRTRSCHS